MNPPDQPCQATPAGDLRQQILDSRVPKNEREWWASREIEKLECELTAASQAYECAMAIHGTVMEERDRLAAELTRLRAEVERWKTVAATMSEEREHNANEASRLRAEVERRNDIINRASVQFFHDGSDGETAAKMLTVLNEAKP